MSAVAFVSTAWRTHQEAGKDCTGSVCLLIKTREMPGERKMDWGKDGSSQVMRNGSRMAIAPLGQG